MAGDVGNAVYLHGFASGPGSTKAHFFRARLADRGVDLAIPDLAPDFTHMTIASQLAIVEAHLGDRPAVLLGSSLGGYLATLTAARHPGRVRALVLMAPAFGFAARWERAAGARTMAIWRERGALPVYHYGRRRHEPLSIALLDDARSYPAQPDPHCPALVLAGRHDESVPLAVIEPFAAARPERVLVAFDAGHEMTEVLWPMWAQVEPFLRTHGVLAT